MGNAQQKGMTLLEVLVATLMIGIGIASSIAMMQSAVRYTESGVSRSVALFHLENMISKMKLNRAGAGTYVTADPTTLTTECTTYKEHYTPVKQAQCDLRSWYGSVRADLPEAVVRIERVREGANQFRATITWDQAHESARGVPADAGEQTDSLAMIFSI